MNSKFPSISYVVTTQYVTNSAGFEHLHREIFTDENFETAKKKATEYYESAIEILTDEGEIFVETLGELQQKNIEYRDEKKFDEGIKLFIRINRDFDFEGKILKKEELFLLDSFVNVSVELRNQKRFGEMVEESLWNENGFKTAKQKQSLDYYLKSILGIFRKEPVFSSLADRILQYDLGKIQLITSFVDLAEMYESICAFMNTSGGELIIGVNEHLEQSEMLTMTDYPNRRDLIKHIIWNKFPDFQDLLHIRIQRLKGVVCYQITVQKSDLPAFITNHSGMKEYYYRTKFGNVLDFDLTNI